MRGRGSEPRKRHWTRERCIDAGAHFYLERKCTPTNDYWWHRETSFTADTPSGVSYIGHRRPYPSMGALKNYWKGMRPFWSAVAAAYPKLNIKIDNGDTPWSSLEEWWIVETLGVIPRSEVARLMAESGMGRTEPAIKRRLYDLGINVYERWGFTVNHLARLIGLSGAVIQKYLDHGQLPFFEGNKCLFIDPADVFCIAEYDWSAPHHHPELEEAVRKALAQRACFILMGFDWRKFRYHKLRLSHEVYTGRIRKQRTLNCPQSPKPEHVKVDDWVKITGPWARMPGAKGRIGRVINIVWSADRRAATQKSPARPACWMATVEFKKLRVHGRPEYPRVHYNVPASFLERTEEPQTEKFTHRLPDEQLKEPRRDRSQRTALLREVGRKLVITTRNRKARDRGALLVSNTLSLPIPSVEVPQSHRGERAVCRRS